MQHHVYASHMYTYIRYRYRFFLWTLSFLKIWIHFLIPDVHLCNTSYYVGFGSCSCAHSTARNCTLQWKHGVFKTPAKNHPGRFPKKTPKTTVSDLRSCPFPKVGHTPSFHQRLGLFAIGEFSPQFFSCLLTKLFVSNRWYAPHTFPKRGTTSQCLIQQMKASRSLISETTLSFDSNL